MLRILALHAALILSLPLLWHYLSRTPAAASADAGSPVAGVMSDAEQNYYDQIFSYAMETLPEDGNYHWQTAGSEGSITAGKVFPSLSKSTCRSYAETLRVNGADSANKGYACRRNNDETVKTWCKLHDKAILTCAVEPPANAGESVLRSTREFLGGAVPDINGLR